MSQSAVSTRIRAINPDGEAITIEVEIGIPFQRDENSWECPVSLTPLYGRLANGRGSNALQSLCLTISLVLVLLQGFREDGGQLLCEDGTQFPLEAYAFGGAKQKECKQ